MAGSLPTSDLRLIKTSNFLILTLNIEHLQGSQRHRWGVEGVLVLVAVMTMVKVEVVGEMTDVIEVIADKHVHKVGEEVTKKFRGMVGW